MEKTSELNKTGGTLRKELFTPIIADHKTIAYISKIFQANLKYNFEVQIAMSKILYTRKKRVTEVGEA